MQVPRRHDIGTCLLLGWIVSVLIATVVPLPFDAPSGAPDRSGLFQYGLAQQTPFDFTSNVLLFAPLGALLHALGGRRSIGLGAVVIASAATGFAVSFAIEYLQVLIPRRDSSLIDVLANTLGAALGALGRAGLVRGGDVLGRAQTVPGAVRALMVGYVMVALLVSAALQARTRLSTWTSEYHLTAGNEPTGDRPWRGRLFSFELTDAATPPEMMRRFAGGEPVMVHGARIAAFDFVGRAPFYDRAGRIPSLQWTEPPRASSTADGGMRVSGRPWLTTGGPAAGLAERLRRSNAFTLRVMLATDDTNQRGPARILSNSRDPFARNFTFGQQGADAIVRLRTPATGLNGLRPEIVVPRLFATTDPRDVLVAYDGAALRVTAAALGRVHRTELSPGASLALAITPPGYSLQFAAADLYLWQLLYVALLFVPAAVAVAVLPQTTRGQFVLGLAWAAGMALLLEGTLLAASGRFFEWTNVAVSAIVGAATIPLIVMALSPVGRPARRR